MKQPFEVGAVGREWTAAVLRYTRDHAFERHIEPHGCAVGLHDRAILRIHKGAAAGRDHAVAQRNVFGEHGAFDVAEVRLAVAMEDFRDGEMLALLDLLVDIDEAPVQTPGQRATHGCLARSHKADKVHLVGFHATSRSSVSKNPGYEMTTESAPTIWEGACPASAAIAKAMAIR